VREIFKVFRTNKLFAKKNKLKFGVIPVYYLGHVVLDTSMVVDARKIKTMAKWQFLKDKIEVRSFLGLANYYSVL